MRLSELRGMKVKTLDGQSLGRVHEVHCENGQVTALMCGAGSFVERLTAKKGGRRIAWECVRKIKQGEVIVTPDPPQRKSSPSASRTRKGTQRSSAPRSRR